MELAVDASGLKTTDPVNQVALKASACHRFISLEKKKKDFLMASFFLSFLRTLS